MSLAGRPELLIVNPNTNVAVTEWLAQETRRVARGRFKIVAVNAASGLAAIETPADLRAAAEAVVSAIAAHAGASGAIIGAFGDPGLKEARERLSLRVVGLGEAGMSAVARGGRRFGIVTLGASMREAILAKAASLGLSGQLAAVRFVPISIPELIADRPASCDAILKAVRGCVNHEGAEAVLLGGAPFAGMAVSIEGQTGLVVIDGVQASMEAFDGYQAW
jgi:Asp/Glu/hydantoin racemase